MLVPRYWSGHRIRIREGQGPQTTLLRWGWSSVGQVEADLHARQRAEAAAIAVRAGRVLSQLERREGKAAYLAGEGIPIREEILAEHPGVGVVITRNRYGAHCLNVADIFFGDVDLPGDPDGCTAGCTMVVTMVVVGIALFTGHFLVALLAVGAAVLVMVASGLAHAVRLRRLRDPAWITGRAEAWCREHPQWLLDLYRTPAGYRLLATHAAIASASPEAAACFAFFGVDPSFSRLCRVQGCFRARLTGKPWRMGMPDRMARSVWPPDSQEATAKRQEWVSRYEPAAAVHASCRHLCRVGTGTPDPRAVAVRDLHDAACRSSSDLPLA